jgi:hypothetical protein
VSSKHLRKSILTTKKIKQNFLLSPSPNHHKRKAMKKMKMTTRGRMSTPKTRSVDVMSFFPKLHFFCFPWSRFDKSLRGKPPNLTKAPKQMNPLQRRTRKVFNQPPVRSSFTLNYSLVLKTLETQDSTHPSGARHFSLGACDRCIDNGLEASCFVQKTLKDTSTCVPCRDSKKACQRGGKQQRRHRKKGEFSTPLVPPAPLPPRRNPYRLPSRSHRTHLPLSRRPRPLFR